MDKYRMKGYAANLLKTFRTKEQAEQFMKGDLYMGRLSYYRYIEDKILGVRDPFEGKIRMNMPEGTETYMDIRAIKTGGYDGSGRHEWAKVETQNAGLSFVGCDDVFVLCCTDIGSALDIVVEEDGASRFSSKYLQFARQYKCGVLFSAEEMAKKLALYAQEHDLDHKEGLIEYSDERIDFEEFLRETTNPVAAERFLFHKETLFQDQYEYRFALLPTIERINRKERINPGENHIDVSVGKIESSFLFDIDGIEGLS